MHELSIAQSIVDGASEEAARHQGGRVSAVHLQLGQLSGVVPEALLFSFDLVCEGSAIDGARLVIVDVPATVFCTMCDAERIVDSIQHICCPVCNAATPDVIRGRELLITGLELMDEQPAAIS